MRTSPRPNALARRLALGAALCCTGALTTASPAFGQGATVPFVTYEAEEGALAGGATVRKLAAPPLDNWSSPELEASGRAFVELKTAGASMTLPNNTGGNVTAIDFRYSIPDAPAGGGITSTLNLYVDGVFRQSLYMSSRQTWLYAGTDWDGMNQDPSVGHPHIFYEEGHALITGAPVAPGSTVTFRKDAANTAEFYWIDCVDLEAPPPPIAQPANSISIADNGAVATTLVDPIPAGAVDSTSAIQKTIDAATAQGKSVWIPQGRFIVTGGLSATGVTIEGAGLWYSAVYRNLPLPVTSPLAGMWEVDSVTMRNFLVDSNSQSRTNADGDAAGINISGTNWLVENMWIQHCSSGVWAKGTGGMVRNCRALSTWGDGVNLNNGNSGHVGDNLTAENNYVRGVGDDGVTINSDVTSAQMQNPVLRNNTTVSVYWADGLRVAGGKNVLVEGNLLCDPVNFPGIIAGIFNGANLELGVVRSNTIVRGGGDAYNQHRAALEVGTGAPGSVTVGNLTISGNVIIDSMQKAIELTSSNAITLDSNVVDGLWVNGAAPPAVVSAIDVASNAAGSATFMSNTVQNLVAGQVAFVNASASTYKVSGMGNVGFDPNDAGPTPWSGSDAGATKLTASCTTPVSLVPGDAGSPEGGGGTPEGGTVAEAGTRGEAGSSPGEPADASVHGGGPDAEAGSSGGSPPEGATGGGAGGANAGASSGCGCTSAGASAGTVSPAMAALVAMFAFRRRRRGLPGMQKRMAAERSSAVPPRFVRR